jgi:hypothetical protein
MKDMIHASTTNAGEYDFGTIFPLHSIIPSLSISLSSGIALPLLDLQGSMLILLERGACTSSQESLVAQRRYIERNEE